MGNLGARREDLRERAVTHESTVKTLATIGAVKITASGGENRVIGVGEVVLVEDTTGEGQLSQHVEAKIRHSILVPIE